MKEDKVRVVFLDRDGTLMEDTHYPRDPEKVVILPHVVEGLHEMRRKGYLLYVVSNQSGVGRGIIKESEFKAVHARFCELLQNENVEIAEFAYCFHKPEDECTCRKPGIGNIPRAFAGNEIDFKQSFTVGDKECDLELGDNLGARAFLVLTGKGTGTAQRLRDAGRDKNYRICSDLREVAKSLE